ncbi:hypothetical protein Pyrfu_1170 [Pyrolobus fumarii 1A]|uniref:PIN domain-containing protein n=1 Tax=Pyrolobus fumarii (strain DSM 11204 / 1A) TaxID=694429 RepID=G0EFK9_PYRF1|nr:hypothetical protein [Pyrolobus fumarii]AEM39033.1 hypothetical protein Pyrfu_1170 [Pyrolobus fumarii 1A]
MSSSKKLRILLDTTYLLPMVGVRVRGVEPTPEVLQRLWERGVLEAYYTPFNILELLGKVSRLDQ